MNGVASSGLGSAAVTALVLQHIDDAVIIVDTNSCVSGWNQAAQQIFGWASSEVIGLRIDSVLPIIAFWDPELSHEAMRGGLARSGVWQGKIVQRRRDGSEVLVAAALYQLYDEQRQPSGLVAIKRDMSARLQNPAALQARAEALAELNAALEQRVAERTAALAASETFYRTLIESAPQVIWFTDAQGNVTYHNPVWSQLTGRAVEESLYEDWTARVHPDDRPAVLAAWQRSLLTGEPYKMESRVLSGDGSYRTITSHGAPVRDASGAIVSWVGILNDISERKRAEQDLAELNRELEAFSYSVSHDLRAPLRQIDGFAGLLARHTAGRLDEAGARYLQLITLSAQRMSRLIGGLLAFSQVGRGDLRTCSVNLNAIIRDVQRELAILLNGRRFAWQVGPLPPVEADPELLRLVMVNLLSNAIKYSGTRAEVQISIAGHRDERGMVVVSVSDNGVGFDPQLAGKLFGLFQRLHSSDEFEGTGIGLATVQRIITRHGGRVWAESRAGEGATFSFTLPCAAPAISRS